jgi:hypothetical protein
MKSAAQVCAQVGAALEPRGLQKDVGVASSFAWRQDRAPQMVLTGVTAVDALTGGLPRASLTEISGPPSSGRTALELALLASLTANGESCALIDAEDAFDPASAKATGVDLDRLLWVRCGNLEQALSATDLVLGAGGFGAVVFDLAGVPAKRARRIPLSYWFRFRRAVERTPTVLVLIGEEPCAQSAASLVLRLEAEGAHWSTMSSTGRNPECGVSKPPVLANVLPGIPSHGRLLEGVRRRARVVRNRNARSEMLKMDDDPLPGNEFGVVQFGVRSSDTGTGICRRLPRGGLRAGNSELRTDQPRTRQSAIGNDFRMPLHSGFLRSGCDSA